MERIDLSNLKIVVVTHSYGTCISQALAEFLGKRSAKLVYIDHPFSDCPENRSSVSVYEKGKFARKKYATKIRGPEVLFYIKDALLTLYFVLKTREKFDLYIGIDNLNAFVGLILRKMKRTKRVIFYTIDYVPERFTNRLLNKIYHAVDKLCCYHVNCLWNISEVMTEARNKNGVLKARSAPQMVVPQGNNYDQASRLPFEEINRFDLVFMGHLRDGKGIEFVIDGLPQIFRQVPRAKLVILGTGPLEPQLKERATRLGLNDKIDFKGFIKDHSDLDTLMARCAVALAPYEAVPNSLVYYSDPGKLRAYLAVGLPIVVTKVPPSAYEIDRAGAGIAIEYDQEEFVRAVVKLLTDDKFYLECRQKAIALGSNYSWAKVFTNALQGAFQNMGMR